MENGAVDTGHVLPVKDQGIPDDNELTVRPEDDGLHITDYLTGDFEWWYFDIMMREAGIFLKIVMHIGTDPLKTRVFPQLAVSVNTPEVNESYTQSYSRDEINAGIWQCHLSVRDEIKIRSDNSSTPDYFIKIRLPQFSCNFRFTGTIEGWKPLGREVLHRIGKKKGSFSWVIPMPGARVEGDFSYGDVQYAIRNGNGYHDHNFIRVDGDHPLHLDHLIPKWYWGKCEAGRFSVVFMDTHSRTNRMRSLMVAENNQIIHSANNLVDCTVSSFSHDDVLKTDYPSSIMLRSTDPGFRFEAVFEFEKILDRKDLLEGVHPLLKFLIKRLVTRPAYHGIMARVKLKLKGEEVEGYGNYESMVFRDR